MDNKYITLFKELAQATAASAETVMDYDREKGDEKGLATATSMRDDFQNLADKIAGDPYLMSKGDAGKLLVASMIIVNQLQSRIKNLHSAIEGYQNDLMPKLQHILDDCEDDDAASDMANQIFVIAEEEK
jgi:hypothetical protein